MVMSTVYVVEDNTPEEVRIVLITNKQLRLFFPNYLKDVELNSRIVNNLVAVAIFPSFAMV